MDAGVEGTASAIGFTAGGGGGGSDSNDLPLLRGGTSFPVRGYPSGTQGGNRAVSGSLEYRFPIALVERGNRLLPVAVDRLWADLFVDMGAAWCPDDCTSGAARVLSSPQPLLSVGAEVILALRFGYFIDLPLRFGVALPLREGDTVSPEFFLRVGRSF
jgi:outer membrane protein assembly factor BamA